MANKPPFDPSKPFEPVKGPVAAAKPAFDPSQPFEPVVEAAAPVEPKQKPVSMLDKAVDMIPGVGLANRLSRATPETRRTALETAGTVAGGFAGSGLGTIPAAGAGKVIASKVADVADSIEEPGAVDSIVKFISNPQSQITNKIAEMQKFGLNRDQVIGAVGEELAKTGQRFSEGAIEQAIGLAIPGMGNIVKRGVKKASGTVLKALANVPEEFSSRFLKDVDVVKEFSGSKEAVEGAVGRVGKTWEGLKDSAQATYDDAVDALGIRVTPAQKAQATLKGKNKIVSEQKLMEEYQGLVKGKLDKLTPESQMKELLSLRRKISDKIGFATKGTEALSSDAAQGLEFAREQIASRLYKMPGGELIQQADQVYAKKINLYKNLKKVFADKEGNFDPGKAEEVLRKMATSDRAGYKTTVKMLQELEESSGTKEVDALLNEMTSGSLNKAFGRESTAGSSLMFTTGAGIGALAGGPVGAVAVPLTFAAMQSPKLLSTALRGGAKASRAVGKVVTPATTTGLASSLLNSMRNKKEKK